MFCWWFIATFCKNVLFMFYSHPLGDVKSHFSHNKKKIIMDIWSLGCLVIVSRLHQFAKQIKWMEIYECLLGLYIANGHWSLIFWQNGSTLHVYFLLFLITPYLLVFWSVTYFTHIIMYTFAQAAANTSCPQPKRDCEWDGHARHLGKAQLWPRAFPPLTSLNVCCCPQWMKERRTKTSGK